MGKFHVATEEEILKGRTADVYFERTRQIIQKKKIDKNVSAEFMVKFLPSGWKWGVLAGVEECSRLLEGRGITMRALPEGSFFYPFEPVMVIEGPYSEFAVLETALLGLICQASGVATKAARCRILAGDKTLLSFGARRLHPAIAPMIERSAYVGGFDGVSAVKSAELLGIEASGTMPHALILITGDTVTAVKYFDEVVEPKVKRLALIDTLGDEKFEAVRVAEALKDKLFGVRLDTPASRRGNFRLLIKEVRWELNLRGFENVKIFVSGGIDEPHIAELAGLVDGFGVGTSLSDAPVIDFAMDITEVEGKPFAKRGKESGAKEVFYCPRHPDIVLWQPAKLKKMPTCLRCSGKLETSLKLWVDQGKIVGDFSPPQKIRDSLLKQLPAFQESL